MHSLGDWIVGNLVALLAFGLALWTARRQWLAGRRAHITAWFAKTPEASGMAGRLVIVNTGAAEAHDVDVAFTTMDGQPWDLRTGGESPLPVPLLSGGDQLHIPVFIILGTGGYLRVCVTWRDKRRGVQQRKTTLSLTGIPWVMPAARSPSRGRCPSWLASSGARAVLAPGSFALKAASEPPSADHVGDSAPPIPMGTAFDESSFIFTSCRVSPAGRA